MVLTAVRTEPKNEKEKNPAPFTRKNDPLQPSLKGRDSLPGENKDFVGRRRHGRCIQNKLFWTEVVSGFRKVVRSF